MLLLSLPLRLLTFDMDDTLFPIAPVVDRANDALASTLRDQGVADCDRVMIQEEIRTVRTGLASPVTYSELRLRAIDSLLQRSSCSETLPASEAFDTWLNERQSAADEMLFPGAVDALRAIRAEHPEVLIGAITNGRGDPRAIPSLQPWFDFALSGEDGDVFPERKPSPRIYELALERASRLRAPGAPAQDVDALRAAWVHVGDCLLNDVDASKRAGATTVWIDLPDAQLGTASFSTASAEETAQRAAKAQAARDAGRVDARIDAIAQLPDALTELLALRGGGGGGTPAAAQEPPALAAALAAAIEHPQRAADVLLAAAASFTLVGVTSVGGGMATRMVLRGEPLAAAVAAGARSGQRWGRVSASFSAVRTTGTMQAWPPVLCTSLAAAAAGAAGAATPSAAPARAAAFVLLAFALEKGAAPAATLAARAMHTIDSELEVRRELFNRPATAGPVAAPRARGSAASGNGGASGGPLQRLQRLVDGLNAELGHEPVRRDR